MRRVVIESPYAGDIEKNVAYARAALAHSLALGEAPLASHLLYTQPGVLNDGVPAQRKLGIEAGWEWYAAAEAVIVYTDLGLSLGVINAIAHANWLRIPVEYRSIHGTAYYNQDYERPF